MEELGFSSTYGSEILKGNLAEGTYVLRIATESCSAWVSNCDIDVGIYGSNNQLLNIGMTEIWRAVRPRSSPAQSTTVPSHCRHYWYRVTGCPTPSSADWPDEWQ